MQTCLAIAAGYASKNLLRPTIALPRCIKVRVIPMTGDGIVDLVDILCLRCSGLGVTAVKAVTCQWWYGWNFQLLAVSDQDWASNGNLVATTRPNHPCCVSKAGDNGVADAWELIHEPGKLLPTDSSLPKNENLKGPLVLSCLSSWLLTSYELWFITTPKPQWRASARDYRIRPEEAPAPKRLRGA